MGHSMTQQRKGYEVWSPKIEHLRLFPNSPKSENGFVDPSAGVSAAAANQGLEEPPDPASDCGVVCESTKSSAGANDVG